MLLVKVVTTKSRVLMRHLKSRVATVFLFGNDDERSSGKGNFSMKRINRRLGLFRLFSPAIWMGAWVMGLVTPAHAHKVGDAGWCVMTSETHMECLYGDSGACSQALKSRVSFVKPPMAPVCVRNPSSASTSESGDSGANGRTGEPAPFRRGGDLF